jgi:hypothetical protein
MCLTLIIAWVLKEAIAFLKILHIFWWETLLRACGACLYFRYFQSTAFTINPSDFSLLLRSGRTGPSFRNQTDAKRHIRLRRPRLRILEGKGLSVRGVNALSGPVESEPDAKTNGKKTFTP